MEIRKISRESYKVSQLAPREVEDFGHWFTRLPEDQVSLQLEDATYHFWSRYERIHFVNGLRLGLGLLS